MLDFGLFVWCLKLFKRPLPSELRAGKNGCLWGVCCICAGLWRCLLLFKGVQTGCLVCFFGLNSCLNGVFLGFFDTFSNTFFRGFLGEVGGRKRGLATGKEKHL